MVFHSVLPQCWVPLISHTSLWDLGPIQLGDLFLKFLCFLWKEDSWELSIASISHTYYPYGDLSLSSLTALAFYIFQGQPPSLALQWTPSCLPGSSLSAHQDVHSFFHSSVQLQKFSSWSFIMPFSSSTEPKKCSLKVKTDCWGGRCSLCPKFHDQHSVLMDKNSIRKKKHVMRVCKDSSGNNIKFTTHQLSKNTQITVILSISILFFTATILSILIELYSKAILGPLGYVFL